MLFILEGADGVGKTTFAAALAKAVRGEATILHRAPPTRHPLEEYELELESYTPGCGRHVICDRWHVGELIYGPLYRGESKLDEPARVHIEMFLRAKGAMLLHLDGYVTEVQRRLTKRGEDYIKLGDLDHLLEAYRHWRERTLLPWETYISPDDGDAAKAAILGQMVEFQCSGLGRYTTYIGQPRPRWLLLGETRSLRSDLPRHQSCFVPYPATSGRYLLQSIHPDMLPYLGIANALDEDLRGLWLQLRRPAVVCLGRSAEAACADLGIPHETVPHPQYVRRFRHGDREDYGQQIREAATA